MITQIEEARSGKITPAMEAAGRMENVEAEKVREYVAAGHAVIPANPGHVNVKSTVIGRAFRTKINANIGHSSERSSEREELRKVEIAISAGADTVMDLSVGPHIASVRRALLEVCLVPLGTVPVYEAFSRADRNIENLTEELLLSVIREHAEQGVDFMTLHAGLLRDQICLATKRKMGIVSRGGAILAEWMVQNGKENPLHSRWDDIMDICHQYDVTVSLGDGLRPGCLADASDEAQFAELKAIGDLVRRCKERGVQVIVEGPGHIPLNEIEMNVDYQHRLCDGAPFYVLGPIVTDIAPGYDHISSAIGAATAAYHGASFLCYVTPAEHLGLPSEEDVRAGVMAYRIAAHAADIARNIPGARDWDDSMADARLTFDWQRQFELALDPDAARSRYDQAKSVDASTRDYCSMCGREFCALRISKRLDNKQKQ